MRVCVVGGGLTGLVAALNLATDNHVVVLEKGETFGGCLSSYHRNGYWLERFYHHLFPGDSRLLALLAELGINDRLEWLRGTTGYYVQGKIHPLTTPLQILKYPHLSLADKARLALLTLQARRLDTDALDRVPAAEFVRNRLGDSLYTSFFEPLLRSKFGDRAGEVSAAWLVSRIAIRSNRGAGGERLGYLKGGFHLLVDRLVETAGKKGCEVRLSTPAGRPERQNGGWRVNGERYDVVLCTVTALLTARRDAPMAEDEHGVRHLRHQAVKSPPPASVCHGPFHHCLFRAQCTPTWGKACVGSRPAA